MKKEDKERLIITFVVGFILFLIFCVLLQVDLINDKNKYILNLTEEKQELTDNYGDMLQKYLDKKHIAEKYQRKYGEIDG